MKMADKFRGDFGVRANADIPRDAKAAREFGAEGIGLCRTEHMFFAEDRLPHVVRMIMAAPRAKTLKAKLAEKEHALEGLAGAAARTARAEVAALRRELAGPQREYPGA